jgi:hypothetical protein
MFPPEGQFAQLGGQFVEGRFILDGERLTKDVAMFRLGRSPVSRRATLQASDEFIIQIANVEVAGHRCSPWDH